MNEAKMTELTQAVAAAERGHDGAQHRHQQRHDQGANAGVHHAPAHDQIEVGDHHAQHALHDRAQESPLPVVACQELAHLMPPSP